MCPVEPELERAQEKRAPETSPVFSRGWRDGVLSQITKKTRLCAPSVASFVLQLPDDTSPRPQSLPKDIAVSDLLPETVPFRLSTNRACALGTLKQLGLWELSWISSQDGIGV